MKMKKMLCLLLCCILLLINVGCSREEEQEKRETSVVDSSKDKEVAGENSNHETIKLGIWGCADWGDDEIAAYLNEKYNVTLEYEEFSWADYIQKLNVSASGGTLPDMFAHPAWSSPDTRATFFSWADQKVIKPLPEDLSDYENISNIMANFEFLRTREGYHYMLPRIAWQPENAFVSQALWVRKDWMENLGMKMPTNVDELYDLLWAFTYEDPDGNGIDDTYGITKGNEELWILNIYQIEDGSWIKEDGKYIPGMISKRNIDVIKFLKRLYDDGILDPDYATIKPDQGMDKFVSGKAATIAFTSEAYHFKDNLVDKMMKINADWGPEVVDIIPPVGSQYGDPVTNSFDNFWSGTLFNGSMSDAKMARCLEIYDFLLSEEGLELGRFGMEGKHFEKNGDSYKSILPIDPDTNLPKSLTLEVPTAGIKTLATWDVDGRWLEPAMPERCIELEKKAHNLLTKFERQIDPRTRYISTPAVDKMQIKDIYRETLYSSYMASEDIEGDFNAFVEGVLKNNGVQEAIDEYNEQIDLLGIK